MTAWREKRPFIGWVMYDFANSAFATSVLAVIFNRYYAEVVAGGPTGTLIHFPWGAVSVPGAALWGYWVAFSTVIVAVSSPLLGAIADRAAARRKMLAGYCYIGVLATIALAVVQPGDVWLGGALFVIANLGFGGGNVFYNAFLLDVSSREKFGRVSGLAWGLGYLGGGLCLVLNLIMLKYPYLLGFPEGYFDVGDCMVVAGLWWGIFALPTVLLLKERTWAGGSLKLWRLTQEGWRRLGQTLRQVKRYRQLVRFLIAYLLFNDGIETIIIMASIFGAEVVGMDPGELIVYFIMVQATALVGSFVFGWLADKIGNKMTLLITLGVWLSVTIWAYKLGWWSDLRTEYYLLGVLAGLVMGGSQSAARSLQALFTPPERAAEFFGFYAVGGKFASIFGTFIFSSVVLLTGGLRMGILAIGLFFLIGGALLFTVNEKEGQRAAEI